MSIMWRYLDKRSATIAAIKDFNNMQFIIRDTGEEIRGVYETAAGVSSPKLDDMPKAHNSLLGTRCRKMTGLCWTHSSAAKASTAPVRRTLCPITFPSSAVPLTGKRTGRWRT